MPVSQIGIFLSFFSGVILLFKIPFTDIHEAKAILMTRYA